jgi:hypothetical protein
MSLGQCTVDFEFLPQNIDVIKSIDFLCIKEKPIAITACYIYIMNFTSIAETETHFAITITLLN